MIAFDVLIPARLESTRLPQKALADLGGRPLIVRVWERACRAGAARVRVVTDSERIAAVVRSAGGSVVMTGPGHDSGTSRLAEAASTLGLDDDRIVVNVQGDEPDVPAACIRQLAALLETDPAAEMATLWTAIDTPAQWTDPDVVKLVAGHDGCALYFSRAPIPAARDGSWPELLACRHVGLYAYRAGALRAWPGLPESPLAASEALEQLRALQAGWKIRCARAVEAIPPGVDTVRDLELARQRLTRTTNLRSIDMDEAND